MTHVCTVKIQTKSSEATCLRTNCIHTSHRFKSVCFCHLTGFRVVYCKLCIQLPQALEFQAQASTCLGIIQILNRPQQIPNGSPNRSLNRLFERTLEWTPNGPLQQASNRPPTGPQLTLNSFLFKKQIPSYPFIKAYPIFRKVRVDKVSFLSQCTKMQLITLQNSNLFQSIIQFVCLKC